jgi:CPA1 family monovalent cation:H+ antiporter
VPESPAEQELVEHRQIRRAVIDAQREAVLLMRDRGVIDNEVLRSIERELDLEEVRMEA